MIKKVFFFVFFYNSLIGQVWLTVYNHQGFSVSSVSDRLLNQEMSIEKGIFLKKQLQTKDLFVLTL